MNQITVEQYIINSGRWQQSLNMLREVVLSLGLDESVKWNSPVYSLEGKNVVGLASFKAYTGLWFYQGVFLKDPHKKLMNASDVTTRAQRQWRFYNEDEIEADLEIIVAYIKEAIENSKQGKEIKPQRNKPYTVPAELKEALEKDPSLMKAFSLFSHSNKRYFAGYVDQAKRQITREKRLNECIRLIREGKGLMDKYRK